MNNGSARVNILGVSVSAVDLTKAVFTIASWIDNKNLHSITLCNVYTVMECFYNPELRKLVNKSGLVVPDGMPLVWLSRYFGYRETGRVYGPDLMDAMCKYSLVKGYRHYFYGGAAGVASELARVLATRYPGLQIAGEYSPPFRKIGEMEAQKVIENINDANPDIVWVGLGTPKQDYWVAGHRSRLRAPVLIPVGAAFDFFTGRISQAPKWMQNHGLEWLFRLAAEPRRLAYRYLLYNPLFIFHVCLQLSGIRRYEFAE